ncbi:unnamed protein product [Protopolystoma xenopodis]|uniref:Uncharacterized protein n=1 Tax=Protopolystoma xenopodis TaxID=117903 RepID=A0A3S5BCK1_9PLAT|nr:unnamed protein product [Protopolystoma xenopodis]
MHVYTLMPVQKFNALNTLPRSRVVRRDQAFNYVFSVANGCTHGPSPQMPGYPVECGQETFSSAKTLLTQSTDSNVAITVTNSVETSVTASKPFGELSHPSSLQLIKTTSLAATSQTPPAQATLIHSIPVSSSFTVNKRKHHYSHKCNPINQLTRLRALHSPPIYPHPCISSTPSSSITITSLYPSPHPTEPLPSSLPSSPPSILPISPPHSHTHSPSSSPPPPAFQSCLSLA